MRVRVVVVSLVAAYIVSIALTHLLPTGKELATKASLTASVSAGPVDSFGLPEVSLVILALVTGTALLGVGAWFIVPWRSEIGRTRWQTFGARFRASWRAAKTFLLIALAGGTLDFLAVRLFDWDEYVNWARVTLTLWLWYMDPDRVEPVQVTARLLSVVALVVATVVVSRTRTSDAKFGRGVA